MQFVSYQEIKDLKEEIGKRHDEDFGSLQLKLEDATNRILMFDVVLENIKK